MRYVAVLPTRNQPELFTVIADDALNFALQRHIYTDTQPDCYSFLGHQRRVTEVELMKKFGVAPVYAAVAQHTFLTAHLRGANRYKNVCRSRRRVAKPGYRPGRQP
jgi:hypothetical protein